MEANLADPHYCATHHITPAEKYGHQLRQTIHGPRYRLRDGYFHTHVWNTWEKLMSSFFPIPTMARQLANAGYSHFRFDAPAPPGCDERPEHRSIYDRPLDAAMGPHDRDNSGAGGGVGGPPQAPHLYALTAEMIGLAPILDDQEFARVSTMLQSANLATRASFERTRMEHEYRWGPHQLSAVTVRRYRPQTVMRQHLRLRLAFGPAAEDGEHAPLLGIGQAYRRLSQLLEREQAERRSIQDSVTDLVGQDIVNRMCLALKLLQIIGVHDLRGVQAEGGITMASFRRLAPALCRWFEDVPGLLSRHRTASQDPDEAQFQGTEAQLIRTSSQLLRPFGLALRRSNRRQMIALDGLAKWQVAVEPLPDPLDERPGIGRRPAQVPLREHLQ